MENAGLKISGILRPASPCGDDDDSQEGNKSDLGREPLGNKPTTSIRAEEGGRCEHTGQYPSTFDRLPSEVIQ